MRDARGVRTIHDLQQDLRYAGRMVRKHAGLTAVVMVTLGVGIGANTALFSVVDAVLLKPLPFPDAGQVVVLREQTASRPNRAVAFPDFLDWQARQTTFDGMAAALIIGGVLSGDADAERVFGRAVTRNFFATLGTGMLLGRPFTAEEDQPGGARVIVLSHGLWQRRYHGDAAVIGRATSYNGESHTIVGVLPATFDFYGRTNAACVNVANLLLARVDEAPGDGGPARAWRTARPGRAATADGKPGVVVDGWRARAVACLARRRLAGAARARRAAAHGGDRARLAGRPLRRGDHHADRPGLRDRARAADERRRSAARHAHLRTCGDRGRQAAPRGPCRRPDRALRRAVDCDGTPRAQLPTAERDGPRLRPCQRRQHAPSAAGRAVFHARAGPARPRHAGEADRRHARRRQRVPHQRRPARPPQRSSDCSAAATRGAPRSGAARPDAVGEPRVSSDLRHPPARRPPVHERGSRRCRAGRHRGRRVRAALPARARTGGRGGGARAPHRDGEPPRDIIGVVRHIRHSGLDEEARAEIYVPFEQARPSWQIQIGRAMDIAVRSATPADTMVAAIRAAIREFDPELPLSHVTTLEAALEESLSPRLFNVVLLSVFGGAAVLLCVVGVYGAVSYSVAQRTREIGVRMTLGAQPGEVIRLVMGRGMRMVLGGVAAGAIMALLLARVLEGLLYGVRPRDPLTYVTVAVALTIVAAAASYLPARRAASLELTSALRQE